MATSRSNMNHSIQLDHHHHHQNQDHHQSHQIPYAMMQSSSSSSIPANFVSKETGAYDLGELDQALFLYLDGQDPSTIQDQRHHSSGIKPPTLNIFPSQPMHVEPPSSTKVILNQIEPLTEQQIMGICALQQSTQEAEEALSQGLEALNQSLSDIIISDSLSCPPNMSNYMGQMAIAINKLSTLEGFVRQHIYLPSQKMVRTFHRKVTYVWRSVLDNLRHQAIHRLHQILTICQAAKCLLAIAEYFHRLRALSSLWLARPRQEQ
ncbi:hypothetical protein GOBAR_DD32092 [Gossypium barbadense]|nr:hypothetical protein GOBAR_DD32092 [Gossypium barbadense]